MDILIAFLCGVIFGCVLGAIAMLLVVIAKWKDT